MKKIFAAMLIAACSAAVFAQEFKFSGEAKTGVYWEQYQETGKSPKNDLKLHSKDDAGGNEGRFRLNMDYDNGNNFGFRSRFDWEDWTSNGEPKWKYAFGYGNFFENQMTVSVGKLGGSAWGTGGPEKWKELEQNNNGGGMRIEWKPGFVPEEFRVNVGFVLNWLNDYNEAQTLTPSFLDLLQESVLGAAFTWDSMFMVRFAFRLDSELDRKTRGTEQYGAEGGEFIYRIEEYMLRKSLPGMEMWALGVYEGVGADHPMFYKFENWMFGQYEPPEAFGQARPFTAQLRIGYDYIDQRSEFHVKPGFYWNFFNKLVSVGALFSYRQDFGNKIWPDSPYQQIEVEPKIQLNFTSSYIAFVYNLKRAYINGNYPERGDKDPIAQTQFINLRFCIYY